MHRRQEAGPGRGALLVVTPNFQGKELFFVWTKVRTMNFYGLVAY